MARPIKDNADYFTHDASMRDDPKIKALRRKFKVEGYGIWCMLLETITDSDNFRLKVNYDILAGDFDIEPELLRQIIQYCIDLELLIFDSDNSFLYSKTLDKRFETLLSKRERDRSGVFASDNTQSKVKKSKEKESKPIAPFLEDYYQSQSEAFEALKLDDLYIEDCTRTLTGRGWRAAEPLDVIAALKQFLNGKADLTTPKQNVRQHFKNWIGSAKLENLQTYSQVFKTSLNGTGPARQTA